MDMKELDKLDDQEILRGYQQGRAGYVLSGYESPSFVHGWRNGVVDSGVCQPDAAQMDTARNYLKQLREQK